MKNMNKYKYFGSPKMFNRALFAAPVEGEGGGDNGGGGNEGNPESNTPTVEELIAKLAQRDADYAKLKNSFDTASSELSTAKKQLKAKMTAEEQAQSAIDERIAALEEENKQMKTQARISDYSKRYMGIGMDEKTAESLSTITGEIEDVDKFFSVLGKFIAASNKAAEENYRQELIKDNPDINIGNGRTDKNAWVSDIAKELATQKTRANTDILKNYM